MAEPLMNDALFQNGDTWQSYLDRGVRGGALQRRRYEELHPEEVRVQEGLPALRALILLEDGCGDCAFSVPYLVRLLEEQPTVEVRIFFREEHPELQEKMLTKGKRAVPKLALMDQQGAVVGTWGPRPAEIQAHVERNVGRRPRSEWYPEVLRFYREEGLQALIREVGALLVDVAGAQGQNREGS